jgi:hypothetical protein
MNFRRILFMPILSLILVSMSSQLSAGMIEREFFSVNLPDGWVISDDAKDFISFVCRVAPDEVKFFIAITNKSAHLNSKEFFDFLVKPFHNTGIKTGEPQEGTGDYSDCYIIPIFPEPGGVIVASLKGEMADAITMFGDLHHPDLKRILLSLKASDERPYLKKLFRAIALIWSNSFN